MNGLRILSSNTPGRRLDMVLYPFPCYSPEESVQLACRPPHRWKGQTMRWPVALKVCIRRSLLRHALFNSISPDYISSRRLLMSLADAGGRLMYAYKDISELAGLTTRIYNLLSTLHNLPTISSFSHSPSMVALKNADIVVPSSGAADEKACLVKGLDVELDLEKGEHLMITGSNGVGKTAIARVIAGLWKAKRGQLTRPERGVQGVFVVPQRAYMVVGTLLDQ